MHAAQDTRGKTRLTSRPLQLTHLLRDACIAASPSWTVIAVFKRSARRIASKLPVPCRSMRRRHVSKYRMLDLVAGTCTVLLGYYAINISRCPKRVCNRDLELGDVYCGDTRKTFLYSTGHTAEVEPPSTPQLRPPSALELCSGNLGASDPSSHQRCTMQRAGMLWGTSVSAA